jgi:hypothetical protein
MNNSPSSPEGRGEEEVCSIPNVQTAKNKNKPQKPTEKNDKPYTTQQTNKNPKSQALFPMVTKNQKQKNEPALPCP